MSTLQVYVGLDYHQDSVQVCAVDAAGAVLVNRAAANDPDAVRRVVAPLGGVVGGVGIEACGGAAAFAQALADRTGWGVSLAHPAYVAKLRQAPDKTDFADGRLLADLTRVGYLPRVWLPPAYVRDLRGLVNHRQQLVDRGRALELRVGGVLREHRARVDPGGGRGLKTRWSKAWVAAVRAHAALTDHARWVVGELLDEVDRVAARVAAADARLRAAAAGDRVVERLLEQDGVGEVTAWVFRAYVGDFGRFRRAKQLARYCGLTPRNASSGPRQADAGLVDGCNRLLRATVVQAAHRLTRTVPRWRALAASMRARGKPACVVAGAVGNRWLRALHHAMRTDPATGEYAT